jgi:hypothetical protein
MNMLPLPVHSPEEAKPPEACFELDMPLHAYTDSDTHVAQLVGTLLNDIADVDHEVSHADVLQALAITTAVRVAMADAATKTGANFSLELLDVDVLTINGAVPRAA